MNLKDIALRLGYFRNKKNLSCRELSLRMDHSESWYYRVENGKININMTTLLKLCDLLDITLSDLFYYDITKVEEDKKINSLIKTLSKEEKESICNLLRRN